MTKHELKTFPIKLIGYIIYQFSCLVPRNKKKWLLGDIMGFSGNTKYWLPQLLEQNREYNYELLWITHNKKLLANIRATGINAYYWLHPMAIWHCLTAGVYIVTDCTKDINCYLSGRAFYVNLWHGIGLKGCGKLSKIYLRVPEKKRNSFYYRVLFFYWIYRVPDLCLTTSEFQLKNFFMPMFGLPRENFMLGMFPRNRIFFKSKTEIKKFVGEYCSKEQQIFLSNIEKYHKIYVYMPTWRDDGRNFIEASGIEPNRLNTVLNQKNALCIFKLHPKTAINMHSLKGFSNIVVLDKSFDLYPILPFTSTLITDYSSIYTDYLLLNKEVIIFNFDQEEYMQKDRDFLFDFDVYTPAKRARNFDALITLMEQDVDCHISDVEREKMLEIYWNYRNQEIDIFEIIRDKVFNDVKK